MEDKKEEKIKVYTDDTLFFIMSKDKALKGIPFYYGTTKEEITDLRAQIVFNKPDAIVFKAYDSFYFRNYPLIRDEKIIRDANDVDRKEDSF